MPTVNGKEYPYTEAGIAEAEEARRREMPNFRQQEMPRGTGFTPGQVYNSPQPMMPPMPMQPMPMQPPNPVMPFQPVPPMQRQQQPQRPQQLSPEEIEMMNRYRNEQMLKQMFMQEQMRGMLSEQKGPQTVRDQEMGRQKGPQTVRDEEMGRYR